MSLRQNTLRETHNYVLGGGEYSGKGGKETKQRRHVGEGGGKDRRQAVTCTIEIFVRRKGCSLGELRLDPMAS